MVESKPKRTFWVECLRVLAIFFVLQNHTEISPYGDKGISFGAMYIVNKIAVPIFFMISGYTLLGKTESWRDTFKKRVLKYTIIMIVYTMSYFLFYMGMNIGGSRLFNLTVVGWQPHATWFMGAYVCFCMILPILRKLVKVLESRHYVYIYGLAVFAYCLYSVLTSFCLNTDEALRDFIISKTQFLTRVDIGFSLNTVVYPLMGYYLGRILDVSKIKHTTILKLWLFTISTLVLDMFMSVDLHNMSENIFQDCIINRAFNVINTPVLFITFRKYVTECKIDVLRMVIYSVAKCSFGIYMVHMFVVIVLNDIMIQPTGTIFAILVLLLSYIIVLCFNALRALISKKGLKINNENMKGESVV